MNLQTDIKLALDRIKPYLRETPILFSQVLNSYSGGHEIIFKSENFQISGSFKIRGVLNSLLLNQESNRSFQYISAYSSGNHAIAIAWAAQKFNFQARIYMAKSSMASKINIVKSYNVELVLTETRAEAEKLAYEFGMQDNNIFLHPSDGIDTIIGSATVVFEAFQQTQILPDAIFVPCGGGALLSGSYLAGKIIDKNIQILGVEPSLANDASQSFKKGKIIKLNKSPATFADGARTLSLSKRTFDYIKNINGFIEVSEEEIKYWTYWLYKLLKIKCEPTSALAFAGASKWLGKQQEKKRIMVVLSGSNFDYEILTEAKNIRSINRSPSIFFGYNNI